MITTQYDLLEDIVDKIASDTDLATFCQSNFNSAPYVLLGVPDGYSALPDPEKTPVIVVDQGAYELSDSGKILHVNIAIMGVYEVINIDQDKNTIKLDGIRIFDEFSRHILQIIGNNYDVRDAYSEPDYEAAFPVYVRYWSFSIYVPATPGLEAVEAGEF